MIRNLCLFATALVAAAVLNGPSQAGPLEKTTLDAMVTRFAAAESVPEELVRRVIKRESRGNPRVVSQGNYGLMQIKLPTARSMGYSGSAAGLLDAETNMTYAVKYLAGAWRVAHGSIDRAVHYYAAGYYYAAKHEGGAKTASNVTANALASADLPGRDNSALMSH
jgi:soluble lytic murein transglycosylase-like protein